MQLIINPTLIQIISWCDRNHVQEINYSLSQRQMRVRPGTYTHVKLFKTYFSSGPWTLIDGARAKNPALLVASF